jgi:DNA-binding CsgD family transcriptional regulator
VIPSDITPGRLSRQELAADVFFDRWHEGERLPVDTAGLIEDLYAGVLDTDVWRRGLESLARAWGARAVVLASYDGASGERLRVEAEPPHHAEVAPLQIAPRAGLTAGMAERHGVCLERTRERLVMLWLPGRESAATGEFDSRHPWIAHLLRALHLRERVAKASLHSAVLDASVERMNLALLLLDANGAVLARSALAAELLARDCGVMVGGDATLRITATGAAVVDTARALGRRSAEQPLRIERADRAPLTLLLSPQGGPVGWMAVLCDPESAPDFDTALIAADLGVTLREAEVAADLCRGLAPNEIARHLDISINTVRSHVKAIYGKSGAHTRVALIRRVATSPAALLRRK